MRFHVVPLVIASIGLLFAIPTRAQEDDPVPEMPPPYELVDLEAAPIVVDVLGVASITTRIPDGWTLYGLAIDREDVVQFVEVDGTTPRATRFAEQIQGLQVGDAVVSVTLTADDDPNRIGRLPIQVQVRHRGHCTYTDTQNWDFRLRDGPEPCRREDRDVKIHVGGRWSGRVEEPFPVQPDAQITYSAEGVAVVSLVTSETDAGIMVTGFNVRALSEEPNAVVVEIESHTTADTGQGEKRHHFYAEIRVDVVAGNARLVPIDQRQGSYSAPGRDRQEELAQALIDFEWSEPASQPLIVPIAAPPPARPPLPDVWSVGEAIEIAEPQPHEEITHSETPDGDTPHGETPYGEAPAQDHVQDAPQGDPPDRGPARDDGEETGTFVVGEAVHGNRPNPLPVDPARPPSRAEPGSAAIDSGVGNGLSAPYHELDVRVPRPPRAGGRPPRGAPAAILAQ